MTDTQGNNTVEEKQPAAIPTENKPADTVEPKLPDGVSERTAAEFDKLKEHNAQLKAENEAYKSKTSVLDDFKPSSEVQVETPNLSTTQVEEIKSKFIDENGFVDVAKVEEALGKAEERAKRAEEKADDIAQRIQNSEEQVEVKAVHAEFPNVDPHSATFDPNFYRLVKLELVDQMMNGTKDFKSACEAVSKMYKPADVSQAKSEAEKEHKQKVTARDQASEEVSSRGKGEPSDLDELKRKTQEGDQDALYKRLQASGN